ncbi:MAG: uracil-DNA glycosylase family protein [Candidatus Spyradocola sp.]
MNELLDGYKLLYETANIPNGYRHKGKRVGFCELSHFWGMKGQYYDDQSVKLLLVGRAPNGWMQLDTSSCDAFARDAVDRTCSDHFSWIHCDQGRLHNAPDENGHFYALSGSPFWRTSQRIWEALSGNPDFQNSEQLRWLDCIAWTNLYKLAPKDGGNPTETMKKKQLSACREILRAEIAYFKPTHILFVTGYRGWFEPFQDLFDADFSPVPQNVEAAAVTKNGLKIAVTCRPERRRESAYIEAVTQALR